MGPIGAILGSAVLSVMVSVGADMAVAALCAGSLGIIGSSVAVLGTRRVDPDAADADIAPAGNVSAGA